MMRFTRTAFALACLLCVAIPAFSQSRNTGEIRGTVTAGGAVLPGAKVTLLNVDTGETKDFVTNSSGLYDTVSTPAGKYKIRVSAPGFKTTELGPVTLQVDVITQDANLEVGAATETVTVTEQAPLLDTETAHIGTIMDEKTIQQLPQIGAGITGNDWANFNILLPGAGSAPSQPQSEGSGSYNAGDAISINGNLPNYANYLQDGAVVQLPVSNNVDNAVLDSIQEVQITTSSFSAEYGIGGAVFNQITKSGTESFHGSAYEYFQNDMLNARPYFESVPAGGTALAPQPVPRLRYDEYGGSVGGPIIKNKLFFFFVTDKIYNNGAGNPTHGTTPTLAERGQGTAHPGAFDFTGLPTLYDPASCATPGCTRTSFAAENTGLLAGVNAIPGNRLDPVAAKILGFYPTPNVGDATTFKNNYSTVLTLPNPNLRFFGRLDYDMSSSNHMSFSIGQKNNPGVNKYGPFACPINCFSGDIDGYEVQATDTWTVSPTMVNEFRMGFTRQGNWFVPQTLNFNPQSTLGLQYATANVFPSINIGGPGICCDGLAPGTNAIYIENLYDPSDTFTLIKGKHVLKFGFEFLMGDGDTTPWGNIDAGQFHFNGNYTAQNGVTPGTTGAGLADFLLGDVQSWNATNEPFSYNRLKSPQAFVQDDWKVRPNLTVNLGLRYTGTTGFKELNNNQGGFDPSLTLNCGAPCGPYNGTKGSLWFAPQNGRDSLQKPIWNIFLPRVGFAWSFMKDTVLRGGFGIYSYNYSQDTYGGGIGFGSPETSSGGANDLNNGTGPNPLISLSASQATANATLNYVNGSPAARNIATYINLANPQGVPWVPYNIDPGMIKQWELSLEHQFAKDYMVSLAYVGSHASNLQYPTDINQITSAAGIADSIAHLNAVQPADRPFPQFGSIQGSNYNGISNYNAMQIQLNKHYASGLLFSVNYVWSHMLDSQDSSGWGSRGGDQLWQIGNNTASNYGDSNFDLPSALKGYVSYELPFGHGKQFLNGSRGLDEVVGGWRIAGTMLTQSGNPFTVVDKDNLDAAITGCGGCTTFPDVTGSTKVSNPGPSGWFNTSVFTNPASGPWGNEGRNSLRGPRLTVFDLSMGKNFSFGERYRLELRSDWVNAFNHPSLNLPDNNFDPSHPAQSNFGLINASTRGGGVAVAPRSGQLSARFTF